MRPTPGTPALAEGACEWLAAHAPPGGGAVFADPSIDGWPHAPWMMPEDGAPASLITTGLIAGTLHARGLQHPWLDGATRLLWSRIGSLTGTGPYDVRAVLRFLDSVPDRDRAHAAAARLGPVIFGEGLVALEPGAPGEVHTPLDFAPWPGSPAREPVRRGSHRRSSRPPGRRPARRRRLDVQLAGVVTGGRAGVAGRRHRGRASAAARQRPQLTGTDPARLSCAEWPSRAMRH